MCLSPDAQTLVTGGEDKFVRVWNVDSAHQSMPPLKGHVDIVKSVSVSPCGTLVASGSADRSSRLWSLKNGTCIGKMEHEAEVNAVCFQGAKSEVIVSASGAHVFVWHHQGGVYHTNDHNIFTLKARLAGHTAAVTCLACHPLPCYSNLVFSGSMDRTIRVFDIIKCAPALRPNGEVDIWKGHSAGIKSISFSPAENLVASGSCDASVRIWKYPYREAQPQSSTPCKKHRYTIFALCWSSDAKLLVSGASDRKLSIWNANDGNVTASSEQGTRECDDVGFIVYALQYIKKSVPAATAAASAAPLTLKPLPPKHPAASPPARKKRLVTMSASEDLESVAKRTFPGITSAPASGKLGAALDPLLAQSSQQEEAAGEEQAPAGVAGVAESRQHAALGNWQQLANYLFTKREEKKRVVFNSSVNSSFSRVVTQRGGGEAWRGSQLHQM